MNDFTRFLISKSAHRRGELYSHVVRRDKQIVCSRIVPGSNIRPRGLTILDPKDCIYISKEQYDLLINSKTEQEWNHIVTKIISDFDLGIAISISIERYGSVESYIVGRVKLFSDDKSAPTHKYDWGRNGKFTFRFDSNDYVMYDSECEVICRLIAWCEVSYDKHVFLLEVRLSSNDKSVGDGPHYFVLDTTLDEYNTDNPNWEAKLVVGINPMGYFAQLIR